MSVNLNDLTIIIPTYNEELVIEKTLQELINLKVHNIIVIDGGSKDSTIKKVKKFDVKILEIGYRSGYGDAFIKGINLTNTKYVCKFNADGSFDPIYLTKMLKVLESNEADVVFNSRYLSSSKSFDDTVIRRVGNFFFTHLCKFIFRTKNTDILYNYHMSKTKSYENLKLVYKDFSICTEIPIKFKKFGFKILEIPTIERARLSGVSKVNAFTDGIKILLNTIKLLVKN